MTLVEQIKNQFTPQTFTQLAQQLGCDESSARTATFAGLPAILSGLTGLTNTPDGTQRLASAMGRFDGNTFGNTFSNNPGTTIDQGTNVLNSIFNNATITGIVNALVKYTGVNTATAQKILAYLMPMILSAIAGRFNTSRPMNPQGLTTLFNDERNAIANAMPAGFSLADVPGVAQTGSVLRPATDGTPERPSSPMRWLVPALGIAAVALVLFFVFNGGPTLNVPPAGQLTTDLTTNFKSVTDSLNTVRDEASAQSAVAELKKLSTDLGKMKSQVDRLPAADKSKVGDMMKTNLAKIEEQCTKLMFVPGVSDKLKKTAEEIVEHVATISGMPVPRTVAVSSELSQAIANLTETLGKVKDATTAQEMLPKLQDVQSKIDAAKSDLDKLGESGKSAIAAAIRTAVEKLKETCDRVTAMEGVGPKVKPVVDAIVTKLQAMSA